MMDNGLLKEVYEKGKKKMAMIPAQKKAPPFMPGRGANPGADNKADAVTASRDAARRRLAKLRGAKKPEGK
jgi:hypothetical protein